MIHQRASAFTTNSNVNQLSNPRDSAPGGRPENLLNPRGSCFRDEGKFIMN